MCTILADTSGEAGPRLEVLQVIEGLVYSRERRQATILLDFMVESQRDEPSSLLVLHPGLVSRVDSDHSSLVHSTGQHASKQETTPEEVLQRLYSQRIRHEHAKPYFRRRKNNFLLQDGEATWTCINQWESQQIRQIPVTAVQLTASPRKPPPFTCFEIAGFAKGVSWSRLQLKLEGPSYEQFVGDRARFWVDGPVHVQQLVETDLAARKDPNTAEYSMFFEKAFAREHIVNPRAYDIVVFRPGTEGVDTNVSCFPASADVFEIKAHLAFNLAHVFVTSSGKFWIDLQFGDAPVSTARRPSSERIPVPAW